MTDIVAPSRRGFLGGLIATVAAPLVVRAEALMPVRNVDHLLYPFRGIIDYHIATDTIVARVDVAYGQLPVPRNIHILSDADIKYLFPADTLVDLRAAVKEAHEHGVDAQIGTMMKLDDCGSTPSDQKMREVLSKLNHGRHY